MKQITAITLPNCNNCKALKSRLRAAGILYEEVDCDKFSKYCDALEAITDTVEYPMVIMNRANSLELYYVIDDYNDVLLKGTIKGDYVLNPQISTDQLINNIINK